MSGLYGAGNRTQDFMLARQAFYNQAKIRKSRGGWLTPVMPAMERETVLKSSGTAQQNPVSEERRPWVAHAKKSLTRNQIS